MISYYHHIVWSSCYAPRVLVQAAFSLFNLPLADIIDSDLQRYKRR